MPAIDDPHDTRPVFSAAELAWMSRTNTVIEQRYGWWCADRNGVGISIGHKTPRGALKQAMDWGDGVKHRDFAPRG